MTPNPSNSGAAPIFVADSDADDVAIFKLLLLKAGVSAPLQACSSGEELMASLSKLLRQSVGVVLPLLIFLELGLPAINGLDVVRWIRDQPQLDATSVVVLAKSEHPIDVKAAAHGGAQCYLAKYPHPTVLRQVVEEARRFDGKPVSNEWFGLQHNLLLRWGLTSAPPPLPPRARSFA
jgi:CheY-like chemotaxis protein